MNVARWIPVIVVSVFFAIPASLPAQEKPPAEKPVRLAWFPRFSPDSKLLISAHGSWDAAEGGEVRVWTVDTGKPKLVIPAPRGVRSVAWFPKGDFIASGDYGHNLRVYDAGDGRQIGEIPFSGNVEVVQITPDGKRVVTALGTGAVRITEWPSSKKVFTWDRAHAGGIWGARLSSQGNLLATAGRDQFVRIYDIEKFEILHELKHPADTNGVAFTKDGKWLATGCGDATIRIFNVATCTEARALKGHDAGSITDLQFAPDGKLLASAGMDRTVRLWDMSDFERPVLRDTFQPHENLVFGVDISPDGKYLASAGWDDRVVVWNLATRKELWSWTR